MDANPEAILVGAPLDGTKNPKTVVMGTTFQDITGIVTYQFNTYRILPLTAPQLIALPSENPAATSLTSVPFDSSTGCELLSFGGYNVENLSPTSDHLPSVADHIVKYLKAPVVIFVQEVQDDNGPTDDGVVSSEATLAALVGAIVTAGGPKYSWAVVNPANKMVASIRPLLLH